MLKITVMRRTAYNDLIKTYENPIEHVCDLKLTQNCKRNYERQNSNVNS